MTTDELLEAFPVTEITPEGGEVGLFSLSKLFFFFLQVFHTSEMSKANIVTPSKNLNEEVVQQVVPLSCSELLFMFSPSCPFLSRPFLPHYRPACLFHS